MSRTEQLVGELRDCKRKLGAMTLVPSQENIKLLSDTLEKVTDALLEAVTAPPIVMTPHARAVDEMMHPRMTLEEPSQLSYAGRAPFMFGNPPRGFDSKDDALETYRRALVVEAGGEDNADRAVSKAALDKAAGR